MRTNQRHAFSSVPLIGRKRCPPLSLSPIVIKYEEENECISGERHSLFSSIQLSLLEEGWRDLFILTAAEQQFSLNLTDLLHKSGRIISHVHQSAASHPRPFSLVKVNMNFSSQILNTSKTFFSNSNTWKSTPMNSSASKVSFSSKLFSVIVKQ